jgi:putative transposase
MSAIAEVDSDVPTAPLCFSLGVSRAAFYRWGQPPLEVGPKPPRARHPRSLGPDERQVVLDTLHSERFRDASPAEVHATLLEENTYLASPRTMYRVLADANEVRERRDQLRHPAYAKPELLATQPNQIWSWDITKLKGPVKWTYFYLFVILDIFSRYVVGWMVAHGEGARLAERLIDETCAKQNIQPGQLTIHADRGPAMTSKTVALLFSDLDILRSHSRPYVSDDNPFSESHFRTLKYRPEFPERFGSLEHARQLCRSLLDWYNTEHHHSGLAFLTPATVHHGRADEVLAARHRVRLDAYAAHPERFVNGLPRRESLSSAVWINPPETTTQHDPLGSTIVDPNDPEVVPVCRTYEPHRRPPAGQLDLISNVEPAH